MTKSLAIPIVIDSKEYPGQSVLNIEFSRQAVRDWCLGLSLLKVGFVDALIVKERRRKKSAEFQVLPAPKLAAKAQADFRGEIPQIRITPSQLDNLLAFFLRYYRDGIAEVSHIDIETIAVGTQSKNAYVTLTVPDHAPPVTRDELEKRIQESETGEDRRSREAAASSIRKHLTLPIALELGGDQKCATYNIRLGTAAIRDWCLGLCLLKLHYVGELIVSQDRGNKTVELEMLSSQGLPSKAQADFTTDPPRLRITPDQLNRALGFLLQYFRDGFAEVNRFDLEAVAVGARSAEACIILSVPDRAPPHEP